MTEEQKQAFLDWMNEISAIVQTLSFVKGSSGQHLAKVLNEKTAELNEIMR